MPNGSYLETSSMRRKEEYRRVNDFQHHPICISFLFVYRMFKKPLYSTYVFASVQDAETGNMVILSLYLTIEFDVFKNAFKLEEIFL
jgi:hypothetical protein